MNLGELHGLAGRALAGEPDSRALRGASTMALQLAEMVGWAPARIDPRGEVRAALDALRASARSAYEKQDVAEIALLHDALADLMDAIARHDLDLEPGNAAGEDIVEI